MGLKRYTAIKDNVITNAYQADLTTRGTGSNSGRADSLETFSIYGQVSSSSGAQYEAARTLVQFPIDVISSDRTAATIPASGSVNFFLNLYNVRTDQTLPRGFTLVVSPVSQSWAEGLGMDLDGWTDLTYGGTGSNWINANLNTVWTNISDQTLTGGSFLSAGNPVGHNPTTQYNEFNYTSYFDGGAGDMSVDITGLVEQWILGTGGSGPAGAGFTNYGVGIMLSGTQESGSNRSYYTKRFSARSSEYWFKRPIIEARWNSTEKDQRGIFNLSSSALSPSDNKNTLYLYNYVRGQLKNLSHPNGDVSGNIYVSVHESASYSTLRGLQMATTPKNPVTGGCIKTGIYTASFALYASQSVVYDKWWSGSAENFGANTASAGTVFYRTGTIDIKDHDSLSYYSIPSYVTNITNLRSNYYESGSSRFRVFTRSKDWSPTIYTVASTAIEANIIEDAYYRVYRVVDNHNVVDYGTGSLNHTRLSYDVSGSYFDFDMSMLEPGYSYAIKFTYYVNGVYQEQPETFKFRIKKYNENV